MALSRHLVNCFRSRRRSRKTAFVEVAKVDLASADCQAIRRAVACQSRKDSVVIVPAISRSRTEPLAAVVRHYQELVDPGPASH